MIWIKRSHSVRIQFTNRNLVEYVYAADGRKLREKHTTAVEGLHMNMGQAFNLLPSQILSVDSMDYAGNIRYRWLTHPSFGTVYNYWYHFDDGYLAVTPVQSSPSPSTFQYYPSFHYQVRDHQGNVSAVASLSSQPNIIEQTNHYFAYGGPWGSTSTNQGFQPYKYNGKELDRIHGLDWYDYGARRYDPAYCMFTQIDPLAEKYPHLNPYVYCAGNPVRYVDPDGMKPKKREALAMADDVYDPGKTELPGNWTWINPEDFGLTLPNSDGFKSAIYGRKDDNGGYSEFVYATAGTDPTSLEDWKQNFKQLKGVSEQYRKSVETAEQIKSMLGDQELTYIGHSLGGGLASANALKTGDPAITFNAAGLSEQTKRALNLNNNADITAYVVRNEIVNKSQALIGLRAEGRISYLPSVPLSIIPHFSRPAMSVVYHTMTYLKLISTFLKDE